MSYALVIDDNKTMADSLCAMLSILGIKSQAVYGSRDALFVLRKQAPAVVFLDINMPGMDGIEVLGFLRREPNMAGVPVVIVSSDDQPETKQRAKQGGAAAYLIKPPSIEIIEQTLLNLGWRDFASR